MIHNHLYETICIIYMPYMVVCMVYILSATHSPKIAVLGEDLYY